MKRFILMLVFLGFASCGQSNDLAAPGAEPENIESAFYPEDATLFTVYRPDSGVRYRITETFLDGVSLEVPNRNAGEEVLAIGNSPGLVGTLALDLDSDPPRVFGGDFTADLTLLRTNQQRRDERLRSKWLQTYTYPTATFVLDEQNILENGYTLGTEVEFPLTGQLTDRDVTIPVTFMVQGMLDTELQEIQAAAELKLMISDLGIEPTNMAYVVVVDDPFEIGVVLVARRK